MVVNNRFNPDGTLKEEHYGKLCPGIGVGVMLSVTGTDRVGNPCSSHEPRFAVQRRAEGVRSEADLLDFPGGGIDMFERAAQVVEREMLEELGVTLRGIRLLFTIEHFPEGQHWLSLTHSASLADGSAWPSILEPHKCSELLFLTPAELLALPESDITTSLALNLRKLREMGW